MDAVMLLRRAYDAGLRIEPVGDQLLVRGPRRAASLVSLLAEHKVEVMAALAAAHEGATLPSNEAPAAEEEGYWRDFFEERAAHREFDGGHSRPDAERLAFGEMILAWHQQHGIGPDPGRCAGCGDELPGEVGLALSDGARVHFDAVRGVDCIVTYGKKWRGAALRRLGFSPPPRFEVWS